MATQKSRKPVYVLVCTEKRGVFAGYTTDETADPITLTDCRMAVYWSADVRGVPGLAANGPTGGCRISPPAPQANLRGITAVMRCSGIARKAWEAAPWS